MYICNLKAMSVVRLGIVYGRSYSKADNSFIIHNEGIVAVIQFRWYRPLIDPIGKSAYNVIFKHRWIDYDVREGSQGLFYIHKI